jgi:penicillin G amidase
MKIVVWLVGLLCVVGALLAGAFLGYRAVSQPNYAAKVVLGGLSAPVSIHRDRNAVPHIVAQSADDALSGLGYAQAQDRLWQFEMNRRLVNGQLAEILGESALDTDKFLRTVGFRRNAARIWDLQDASTRSAVLAYVAGINAAIADVQGKPWRQSPEFFLTNAEPIPWTPEDVIGWSSLMAWDLSGNMNNELLRAALWSRLGRARLQQLLSTDPEVNLPDFSEVYGDRVALSSVFELLYVHLVKLFPGVGQEGVGSNNWVVSGARSASGKPILANDPHLSMPSPALWHLAHLSWPGHELVGGGMPGLPFILSGRTKNFAWGLTNFNSDSQDVVLEELVPSSSNLYVAPKGVSAMKVVREEILVKDGPAVTLEIRETRNGPIISDVLPVARQSLGKELCLGSALDPIAG